MSSILIFLFIQEQKLEAYGHSVLVPLRNCSSALTSLFWLRAYFKSVNTNCQCQWMCVPVERHFIIQAQRSQSEVLITLAMPHMAAQMCCLLHRKHFNGEVKDWLLLSIKKWGVEILISVLQYWDCCTVMIYTVYIVFSHKKPCSLCITFYS